MNLSDIGIIVFRFIDLLCEIGVLKEFFELKFIVAEIVREDFDVGESV